VRTYAAFTGALFAAVCWIVTQRIYIMLQIGVAKANAIYGSFATIPLFLVWFHLTWLFILLGALLAYAVQHRKSYELDPDGGTPQRHLQRSIDILNTVYDNFNRRVPTTLDNLSDTLVQYSPVTIQSTVESLISGGLLAAQEDNGQVISPVTPGNHLDPAEVFALVIVDEELDGAGGEFASQVGQAAKTATGFKRFPVPATAEEKSGGAAN
jgi:membrane protein